MKFRIIGTLFVLAILAALVVLQDGGNTGNTQHPVAPQSDNTLQPLKIQ